MRGQHGEDGQCEGDVGGDRHGPPVEVFGVPGGKVDADVDGGGNDHSADSRGDRERGPARVTQIPRDELALEFQTDDEEEDRQAARRPPTPKY